MDEHFKVLDHQDWKQIIINNKKNTKKSPGKKISQAQQKDIKILKQVEEDDLKHKKIANELRTKIQQSRLSSKLTQKQLAQKCNFPVSVINDIETGKAIYNPQQINKLKRILKI